MEYGTPHNLSRFLLPGLIKSQAKSTVLFRSSNPLHSHSVGSLITRCTCPGEPNLHPIMVHLVLNGLARRKLAESEKKENVPRDLPLGCSP
ncbi:hypothetical protein PENSUB_7459 [Penicillium subrubescens]|uniref:Uncharacterized protein n=1 Tax=Penicillium subrubescens TaxID=1316194 RepID=A0A1Q5TMM2_9EURO|nr:hypothetical protein PENSUB_7459 [Penicillium subrubescens]